MLAVSRYRLNFFPLGRRGGAANAYMRYGEQNNVTSRTWGDPPRDIKKTTRGQLTLDCPLCSFRWDYDTLTVYCPAADSHNKREYWLKHDWIFNGEQPLKYYKSMPVTFNPRTHQWMADGHARAKNNERRMQGLTSKHRTLATDRQGMSRFVSNIGTYSTRWDTHFSYPG